MDNNYKSPNPYLSTSEPEKESILDRLTRLVVMLCILIFLCTVFEIPVGYAIRHPLQFLCDGSALK